MKDFNVISYYFGLDADPEQFLRTAKKEGFAGVEVLFHFTPQIYDTFRELGLKLDLGYYGVEPDGSIADADYYHKLGVKYVQWTDPVLLENYEATMRGIEELNRQAAIAKKDGFKVYVHNHPQDFKWNDVDNEYCWETVAKNADPDGVVFQLDAGWAGISGVDVIWLLRKYGHQVKSMHVKANTKILGVTAVDALFDAGVDPLHDTSAPTASRIAAQERILSAQGRMEDSLRGYQEVMELAEEKGCETFTLERDFFTRPEPDQLLAVLREDLAAIRKFW